MQNTITARRISFFWVALVGALVAIALVVGFAVGRTSKVSAATSANAATTQVQPQSAQRLLQLNELLYPSNPAVAATLPQRNQRLLDLNGMLYPSSTNEPTFWNGQPH